MSATLPSWLAAAVDARLHKQSRAPLAVAAERLSSVYRAGGHTDDAVKNADAALAYAVARMPATFAAISAALARLSDHDDTFTPTSTLDIGAGPATATIAAVARFPAIERCDLVEPNPHMRALAADILAAAPALRPKFHLDANLSDRSMPRFAPPLRGPAKPSGAPGTADVTTDASAIASPRAEVDPKSDLVMLAYMLTEQPLDKMSRIIETAIARTGRYLLIVEPGTSHAFARIRAARAAIDAAGLHIVAPCPHANACPLPADDWCHFTVRLPRRKEHRLLKQADAPFEDEPYSYVIATRTPPKSSPPSRILRDPAVTKGEVHLQLCTPSGLAEQRIPRRNKLGYKAASRRAAGDTFDL